MTGSANTSEPTRTTRLRGYFKSPSFSVAVKKWCVSAVVIGVLVIAAQEATKGIAMSREPARPLLDVAPDGFAECTYEGTTQIFVRHSTLKVPDADQGEKEIPHGPYVMMHANGVHATIGQFSHGKRHGEWNRFYDNGKLRSWEVWDNGSIIARGR